MALAAFQRTVTNDEGNVIPNAEVSVVDETTGVDANIFEDREGNTEITELFTDSDGFFRFYVAPGTYRITVDGPGGARVWRWVAILDTTTDNDWLGDNNFIGTLQIDGTAVADIGTGKFDKSDASRVAWDKDAEFEVSAGVDLAIQVDDALQIIESGTSVTMPSSPTIGNDYAIWAKPDGSLEATEDFEAAPATGARRVGGFHYAPGGNATLDSGGDWANHTGGDTNPQINEYSFWDLKWRPSAPDPRGLAYVPPLNEWWGIYSAQNGIEGGPIHMYNVDPTRDGNEPYKIWANNDPPQRYDDGTPMNLFELIGSQGFRPPNAWNFQTAALGTTEETSAGGDGPGLTGDMSDTRNKERFTSAWGLFDITGVIRIWAADELLSTSDTTGVTQGRSDDIFRISRFADLGGRCDGGSGSGSRFVTTSTSTSSGTDRSVRGVCDHVVLP